MNDGSPEPKSMFDKLGSIIETLEILKSIAENGPFKNKEEIIRIIERLENKFEEEREILEDRGKITIPCSHIGGDAPL